MTVFLLILIALFSYFLGSINGAILISRLLWHEDIRRYGSKNAGLTNFMRRYGVKGAALVVAVDVLKTVIAVSLGGLLLSTRSAAVVGKLFALFCLILGHNYPYFYRLRGGKGVLCGGTALWLIDWRLGLICWLVFLLVLLIWKMVSLGSVAAAAALPLACLITGHAGLEATLALFCALLLVFKHRGNLIRILHGKEPKLKLGKPKPPGY